MGTSPDRSISAGLGDPAVRVGHAPAATAMASIRRWAEAARGADAHHRVDPTGREDHHLVAAHRDFKRHVRARPEGVGDGARIGGFSHHSDLKRRGREFILSNATEPFSTCALKGPRWDCSETTPMTHTTAEGELRPRSRP